MKFYPWGQNFPGSPFKGGGLNGAGFGIVLDLDNNVWVGNFGFEDPPCRFIPALAATRNSVSVFGPDGTALSPSTGYTAGRFDWPQGMAADRRGNIWVANCASDSVTRVVSRSPFRARNIPLGPASAEAQIKPFGVSVDLEGNVWVNGNLSDKVYVLSPKGILIETLPGKYKGKTVLTHPVGNAVDSKGNVWVANSDWLSNPCPAKASELGTAENPSVTMFRAKDRKPHPRSPFTRGGITLPWGLTVDGNDTVWVFNFGVIPPLTMQPDTPVGISRLCGVRTEKCPPGKKVGDPISPPTGYRSNSLTRLTGGQVDPSGNLWLMNNWKIDVNPFVNPGGNSIVIVVGAAGPVKTPTIGPPVPFD
jgi:hypothetical protein